MASERTPLSRVSPPPGAGPKVPLSPIDKPLYFLPKNRTFSEKDESDPLTSMATAGTSQSRGCSLLLHMSGA
jgi:hypothetical protein